ncbi:MAG TPA: TetR/AcrR family transcriptional regulator [Acidiphilium sp.]|nr:MAG: hypothetical protein B7Z67_03250 [Acidiphilium sp. 21-60-14]OYV91108.1 MAG: hypothetical protein B7Z57_05545 [Acidiphilium sp. 37-60-79]OZB39982.1 MAG: hypothetical protein B7X48_07010 [Acidiphilium sp. 34-60-192]HQT86975.1 TetR/AcrR family transcriptional regulator [Acidiphilium sp.]HQU22978.1 TetR/AcrR family transcriptional regulator [Acidiphilium sp.]
MVKKVDSGRAEKSSANRARRTRRSAPEARRQILDAAEAQLAHVGPGGLRLQSIAAEIGLSHPVILHHFGSRERLIDALNARTIEQLKSATSNLVADAVTPTHTIIESLVEQVFNAVGNGLAQRLAWLASSGAAGEASIHDAISHIARLIQASGTTPPPPAESYRIALLVASSALGAAIFGSAMSAGSKNIGVTEQQAPFRAWLSDLILLYLSQSPNGLSSTAVSARPA